MELSADQMIARALSTIDVLAQKQLQNKLTEEEMILHNRLCSAVSSYYLLLDLAFQSQIMRKKKEIDDAEASQE